MFLSSVMLKGCTPKRPNQTPKSESELRDYEIRQSGRCSGPMFSSFLFGKQKGAKHWAGVTPRQANFARKRCTPCRLMLAN